LASLRSSSARRFSQSDWISARAIASPKTKTITPASGAEGSAITGAVGACSDPATREPPFVPFQVRRLGRPKLIALPPDAGRDVLA